MTQEDRERIVAIVRECARTHNVSDDVVRRVADAVRPSIRLTSSLDASESLGACRLGGLPDLPADVSWPTFPNPDYGDRECPYHFLMQIDLAAVRPFDARGLLPRAGHLFFFCHWQDGGNNFDWAGEESMVVFAEPGAALRRAEHPGETEDFRVFRPKGLTPAVQWMVPAPCEAGFEPWGGPNYDINATPWAFFEELESRIERVGAFAAGRLPRHRLLGYADFIQSPGVGDNTELLAQVDTDPGCGLPRQPDDMLWGDCGMVYFLIDHDALAERRFHRAFSTIEMC
jgi:uncharacterized protein YwqG